MKNNITIGIDLGDKFLAMEASTHSPWISRLLDVMGGGCSALSSEPAAKEYHCCIKGQKDNS